MKIKKFQNPSGPIALNFGEEQEALKWINDWYLGRKDIWNKNVWSQYPSMKEEVSNTLLNRNIDKATQTPSVVVNEKGKIVNADTYFTQASQDAKNNAETESKFLNKNLKNYAQQKFNEEPNLKGVYNLDDQFIMYPEGFNISTALHELIHAGGFYPAVEAIRKRGQQGWKGNQFYAEKFGKNSDYIYKPEEIYSRLMQLRHALNIDKTKHYELDEIRNLKNTYRDYEKDWWNKPTELPENYETIKNLNILNAFSDEDLQFLFNEVAYNNPSNLDIQVPEQMQHINPNDGVSFAKQGKKLMPKQTIGKFQNPAGPLRAKWDKVNEYATPVAKAASSFIPLVGTYQDYKTFKENPTWGNAGWLALSALGDALTLTGIGAGAGTAIKAGRAARVANAAYDTVNAVRRTGNALDTMADASKAVGAAQKTKVGYDLMNSYSTT